MSTIRNRLYSSDTVNTVDANERLWYKHPGIDWNSQALHLGNGYFGVSFYGGLTQEVFNLSEKTFWTGGPGDSTINNYGIKPGGKDNIAEIRRLILDGKISEADKLWSRCMTGERSKFGALSTIGNLCLNFDGHAGTATNYIRELDLSRGIGLVAYEMDGVRYRREYFCSYPARALVVRIASDKSGAVSFNASIEPAHQSRKSEIIVDPERGLLEFVGNIDDNNRAYRVKIRVLNDGGALIGEERLLRAENANAATVIYTVATEYELKPPSYRGADPEAITGEVLARLEGCDYDTIRVEHVADYQGLYLRTRLHLAGGRSDREALPTDARWKFYAKQDYADIGFRELAFNFGKYLLISSSRPGALPDGLQGAWNCQYAAPWQGNYQININIPLIYMPGNVLGLSECNEPFLEWIEASVIPGREVAEAYYGTSGWVSHATGNIWGNVAPGSMIEWGAFPCGAAWECRHLWEQYEFTLDKAALRERFYPVMKEAAQFWLENLAEYQGTLVAIPAVSAEQRSPKGYLLPSMQDIILVRDLFSNVIKASEVLGVDTEFRATLANQRARLAPLKIGRLGQLQEWLEDVDEPNCHHRHFMHLLAVQPCEQINPHVNRDLTEAARVSMNLRGDGDNAQRLAPDYRNTKCSCLHCELQHDPWIGGNWSRSWKCWIWARLLDGERADKIFSEMLGEAGMENLCTYQQLDMAKEENARTPMQLDGSVTTPGFMAEMLMQSHNGEIELLPALPKAWSTGKVTGLRARGGVTVDMEWKDGKVASFSLVSKQPHEVKVRVNGELRTIISTSS